MPPLAEAEPEGSFRFAGPAAACTSFGNSARQPPEEGPPGPAAVGEPLDRHLPAGQPDGQAVSAPPEPTS
jgi:hypothetical protein